MQPVHSKGDHSWVFFGRNDAKGEAPVLWSPDAKNWLIGKDPDDGKDWRQEEKRMTEDELAGWYHRLNGHEFEQTAGVGDGQGSLVCCKSWGREESDMTEWLNWTELNSPQNSPGQNIEVGSLSIFQGIFPTQGLNPGLPCSRQILYQLSHQGSQ